MEEFSGLYNRYNPTHYQNIGNPTLESLLHLIYLWGSKNITVTKIVRTGKCDSCGKCKQGRHMRVKGYPVYDYYNYRFTIMIKL
jgi:hypothetical protein